jgi:hypothetical protein
MIIEVLALLYVSEFWFRNINKCKTQGEEIGILKISEECERLKN